MAHSRDNRGREDKKKKKPKKQPLADAPPVSLRHHAVVPEATEPPRKPE